LEKPARTAWGQARTGCPEPEHRCKAPISPKAPRYSRGPVSQPYLSEIPGYVRNRTPIGCSSQLDPRSRGLSWEKLIVVPPPPDAESKPAEEREDPLWADAWIFSPANWPSDPMVPLGKRNAKEQAHARLRSAVSWLRLAFFRAWTATATLVSGDIAQSRLRKIGGIVSDYCTRTLKGALLRLMEGVVRLERWARFKRRSGG
jgi:hypothetical protein